MKMHKKLFALLATAAVGLTLTSCGGGGGGGGDDKSPSTDVNDGSTVTVGAPASLVGRTLKIMMKNDDNTYNTFNFTFTGSTSISGTALYHDGISGNIVNANYDYIRDSSTQGRFIHFRFSVNWQDGDVNDFDWSTLELYFNESGIITGTDWNVIDVAELH